MKRLLVIFIMLFFVLSLEAQKNISGRSPQKQVSLSTADYSNGIPVLSAKAEFIEPSGNNLLDAEETAKIKITITNSGDNSAFDVGVNVAVDDETHLNIYQTNKIFDQLKSGQTVISYINLSADSKIQNSTRKFDISFSEHGGFIARPIVLQIETQKLLTPKLVFIETGIKELQGNKNNIIEQGELILATVLIQNKGQGIAENVTAKITGFGNGLISTKTKQYPLQRTLGKLQPGDTATVKFAFSASWGYNGSDILPLKIVISEKRNEYGGTYDLGLQLNVQQLAVENLTVKGQYEQKKEIKDASLTADIDKNIPENPQNKNRFALIIGNEHYVANNGLAVDVPYAINDAFVFKKYAEKTLGIPADNIMYITDARTSEMKNAISAFVKLMQIDGSNREFYIYYAGHGFYDQQDNPYLMPVDVKHTAIGDAVKLVDFYADLAKYQTKMTTVFLDACFSGGGRGNDGLVAGRTGVRRTPKQTDIKGNIVVFTASSGKQTSKPYNEKKHGLFTYFLLKELQQTNGDITYEELAQQLENQIVTKSVILFKEEQKPSVKVSPNIQDKWQNIKFK